MSQIKLLFFIFSSLLILSLTCSFNFLNWKKKRDYVDIADEISTKVSKTLCKRHQMVLIGDGGGMMGSVYMIGLHFQIRHPLDRTEARQKLVDSVEELLSAINSNEEIRPYLKNYPFTTKNIQLSIFSIGADGREVFDPFIRVVSIHEGDYITFSTKEPNKIAYKHRHKELYSEARAMVKSGVSGVGFVGTKENSALPSVTSRCGVF